MTPFVLIINYHRNFSECIIKEHSENAGDNCYGNFVNYRVADCWISDSGSSYSDSSSYGSGNQDSYGYPENNNYYTSDNNHNYNSYYAQLHDEAAAGDPDAIAEMREEFGNEWEGMY